MNEKGVGVREERGEEFKFFFGKRSKAKSRKRTKNFERTFYLWVLLNIVFR